MILEVKDIHTYYGLSHVLFGVSLNVKKGEIVCLLGRNGAGKTTTMRSIMGLTPPKSGKIIFKGMEIQGKPPHEIAMMGIGFVPGERRIFPDLTVKENLEIAEKKGSDGSSYWNLERIYELFPKLKEIESRRGGYLSGGEQQMLAIARALMGNPELLLLDEPTEGLAPVIVQTLIDQIRKLKELGISILLAEQDLKTALALGDRAYIIESGEIKFSGPMDRLREDKELRERYLMV